MRENQSEPKIPEIKKQSAKTHWNAIESISQIYERVYLYECFFVHALHHSFI